MPLKPKYQKIKKAMIKKYGAKKGEQVFYAWANKQGLSEGEISLKAYKFYSSKLKSLDDNTIEGYISTGDKDLLNDIVTPNCMVDMLNQMQDRTIKLDVEHESFKGKNSLEKEINKTLIPIAKITESSFDTKGVKVKTVLNPHHSRFDEVKGSIKDGFLDYFSIAYVPTKFSYKTVDETKTRMLEKVNLLNAAYTGNPVNTKADFTNVALKAVEDGIEYDEKEIEQIVNEIENKDVNNQLKGGLKMAEKVKEETKDNEETPEKKEETAEKKEESISEKEPEKTEESVEVKALKDKIKEQEKEIAEFKANKKKTDKEKEEEEAEFKKRKKNEPVKEKEETEVKALNEKIDGINKSIEELKSLFEKKDGENNDEKIAEQLKAIEEKQQEFDKVLSSPQFKSKVEQMKEKLNEEKKESEVKSIGPLDVFK